jgi:hypothetical protein
MLFSQSAEDAETAIQERIMPEDRVVYIGNGVPLNLRAELGSTPKTRSSALLSAWCERRAS